MRVCECVRGCVGARVCACADGMVWECLSVCLSVWLMMAKMKDKERWRRKEGEENIGWSKGKREVKRSLFLTFAGKNQVENV